MVLELQLLVIIKLNTLVQLYKKILSPELVQKYGTLFQNIFVIVGEKITKELRTLLINILDNEDDYIVIPMIVQRMSV